MGTERLAPPFRPPSVHGSGPAPVVFESQVRGRQPETEIRHGRGSHSETPRPPELSESDQSRGVLLRRRVSETRW